MTVARTFFKDKLHDSAPFLPLLSMFLRPPTKYFRHNTFRQKTTQALDIFIVGSQNGSVYKNGSFTPTIQKK